MTRNSGQGSPAGVGVRDQACMEAPAASRLRIAARLCSRTVSFVLCRSRDATDTTSPSRSTLVVTPRSEHPRPSDRPDARARTLAAGRLGSGLGDPVPCADDPRGARRARPGGIPVANCSSDALARRWTWAKALRVVAGLATALRQLHGRGLIHKDIKPANVMADGPTGQVVAAGIRHRVATAARAPACRSRRSSSPARCPTWRRSRPAG